MQPDNDRTIERRGFINAGLLGLAAAGLAGAAEAATANTSGADADGERLSRAICDAYAKNDYEKYFSFFADDITIFRGPAGRWTKTDYYTLWSRRIGEGGGVTSADIEDLRVQRSPSGDALVCTFFMHCNVRFPNNTPPPGAATKIIYNMTEVWFRRPQGWIMTHMYWSVQPQPSAAPTPAR